VNCDAPRAGPADHRPIPAPRAGPPGPPRAPPQRSRTGGRRQGSAKIQTRTRHPSRSIVKALGTVMITSGAAFVLLLHHPRRVTPRHARLHDYAGALDCPARTPHPRRTSRGHRPVRQRRNGRGHLDMRQQGHMVLSCVEAWNAAKCVSTRLSRVGSPPLFVWQQPFPRVVRASMCDLPAVFRTAPQVDLRCGAGGFVSGVDFVWGSIVEP
jgi:hypothetical protein